MLTKVRSSGLLFSFPFAKLPARISCIDVYFRGTGRERKKIIREERDDTKGEGRKETRKLQIYTERARCIIRAESLAKFELCRTKGIVGEKEREREPIPLILIGFECIWVYRCGLWCTHVVMYRPRVPKLSNESRFRRTSTRRFPR